MDPLSGNLYNTECLVNMGFYKNCELYTMAMLSICGYILIERDNIDRCTAKCMVQPVQHVS